MKHIFAERNKSSFLLLPYEESVFVTSAPEGTIKY